MGNVIYICPKDGTRHDDHSSRFCEVCGGALKFYCIIHSEWLFSDTCPKCGPAPFPATPPPVPQPAPTPPPPPRPTITPPPIKFGPQTPPVAQPLAPAQPSQAVAALQNPPAPRRPRRRLFLLAAVFLPLTCTMLLFFHSTQVAYVSPLPPTPVIVERKAPPIVIQPKTDAGILFPDYPPIQTSIAKITLDPDRFAGKLVTVSGSIQIMDSAKKSFDLSEDSHSLQVIFKRVTATTSDAEITSALVSPAIAVTGLLLRDTTTSSYYILAQHIESR